MFGLIYKFLKPCLAFPVETTSGGDAPSAPALEPSYLQVLWMSGVSPGLDALVRFSTV